MSSLRKYGVWNEESMSNDLGKNENFLSNWLELYHNAQHGKATSFNNKILTWKTHIYLFCYDNGKGMNDEECDEYLELNKDIYGKRSANKDNNNIQTHAFGGKGGKDAKTAIFNGIVHIISSAQDENTLNWITYDTNKSWGEKFENPKRIKIVNEDIDEENISASQLKLLNNSPISNKITNIIDTSGFIIFGKLKSRYVHYFKKEQHELEKLIKDHCNNNLKKCKVIINKSILDYTKSPVDDKYIIETQMNLWKSSKTVKYILSFTWNNTEYTLKKQKKGSKLQIFKKKNYTHLAEFTRKDVLVIEYLEKLFYHKLNDDSGLSTQQKEHYLNIPLIRFGTKLIPCFKKSLEVKGDYWKRDIYHSIYTSYLWNPQYDLDKLFQISADKLNPNISKVKNILPQESYKLLTNHSISNFLVKHTQFKFLKCLEEMSTPSGGLSEEDKYNLIKKNYKSLKSELKNPEKLINWFKKKQQDIDDIQIEKERDMSLKLNAAVNTAVNIALKSWNSANTLVIKLDIHLRYPHFKRDHALDNAMKLVQHIRNMSNKIENECGNLKYTKSINFTLFYYKINNPVNIKNNTMEFKENLMYEGEIGVTNQALLRRHPKANIYYRTFINADGSITIRGNKRVIEKKVIDALKKIDGLEFGTKEHPRSKEQFRFPINKRLEVFHKICDNVRPYEEEGDIFAPPVY
tara:strand:+ start:587 stop:2656 length:2070 start_codon:yes stop_codon:yes gene_type:complete